MDNIQSGSVSSKAIVKYEDSSVITAYRELEKHTDLNQPPPNWLKDNIIGNFTDASKKKRDGFDYGSLLMANRYRYPDYIGEVDVVSAAENIKRLLKMPFSNRELSLTVNRIGKSLLLNEIDIPALLQPTEMESKNKQLEWLRQLYCSAMNAPDDLEIHPKKINKEDSALQKILSKFMHYSIENTRTGQPEVREEKALVEPLSRQPKVIPEDESPSSSDYLNQGFQRDILWNFEDITMLVGSDLPIFGGGKYPTVSLRLRDSVKPINILTGIDYWLDNLMCNVPEILMCYHDKGIVQKYEKIKTSELPSLEGSSFSTKVIKDVAQNILSFLKANCTKEGHTYWLFRSNKDDLIKLYDLTSVYEENRTDASYNPFTLSVAMLLYRIVCNMFDTDSINLNNVHRVRSMLEQCIFLLEKEEHYETKFWASFLLIDLLTKSLKETSEDEESDYSDDMEDSDHTEDDVKIPVQQSIAETVKTTSVKSLCYSKEYKSNDRRLSINYYSKFDRDTRSKDIITYSASSLLFLKKISNKENMYAIEETSNCRSLVPAIKLKQPVNLSKHKHEIRTDFKGEKNVDIYSLQNHLIMKSVSAYLSLISLNIVKKKFGRSLRFLRICSTLMSLVDQTNKNYLSIKAKMLFADILTMIAKEKVNIKAEQSDLEAHNQNDQKFMEFIDFTFNTDLFGCNDLNECFIMSSEGSLTHAFELYEICLTDIGNERDEEKKLIFDLTRRLGNVRNELGVLYMNKAASMAKCYGPPTENETSLWKKCFSLFEKAIQAFEIVSDWSNIALLHSNSGKLMRLCAQVYGYSTRSTIGESRGPFTQQEKTCYNKAFDFYRKALNVLDSKSIESEIKTNVYIEFSQAYFNMANTIQDHAPLKLMAEENVVKEVSSLLNKSTELCEKAIERCSSEQRYMLLLRLGHIHQRLASLNHHMLRNQISDTARKNYRSLAELNYKKACNYMDPERHCEDFLKIFVEYVSLYEYLLEQNNSVKLLKIKFELFLGKEQKLLKTLQAFASKKAEEDEKVGHDEDNDIEKTSELEKVLFILEQQLTSTFKEMLKSSSNLKISKGTDFLDKHISKQYLEITIRGSLLNEKNVFKKAKALHSIIEKCYSVK